MCNKCCSSRMVFVWTVLTGLAFIGSLVFAFWGIPQIIKSQLHGKTSLTQDTEQWERFVELPFSINFTVRFFTVNNTDDVVKQTALPNLTESAPYTYKLILKKTDITFDDSDEDSVTYRRIFTMQFDNSGTAKDDTEVTIVNPLLMSALQTQNALRRIPLAGCLDRILGPTGMDKLFITKPVKDLLFDGVPFAYKNASNLGYACERVRQMMIDLVKKVRVIEHIQDDPDNDYLRLAIFNYKTENYVKDGTHPDGIYTVNRGIKDMKALGTIMRWNGGTTLSTYGTASSDNSTCQTLKGTDSTIYSPMMEEGQVVSIYNTDICRTVDLEFKNSDEEYLGIKAFRYETPDTLFRQSTLIPDRDCYCTKQTKDEAEKDTCFLDGVLDFQPCVGVPLLLSQPHFLNADEKYLNGVVGLSPNKDKHGIFLMVEPNTGTPLQGRKRVQMNTVFRQEPLVSFLTPKEMHQGVIPIFWIDETVDLPQEYVDELKSQYFKTVKIATGLKFALIAVLAALLAGCLYLVWRKEHFKKLVTS